MDGITDLLDMSVSKLWERLKDREAWCAAVHGVSKTRTGTPKSFPPSPWEPFRTQDFLAHLRSSWF